MKKFQKIYDENKELDKMFINNTNDLDIVRKNKLELLVEIGELANETKCFKYWIDTPCNMTLVKEEYADCIIMTLCFFNYLNVSLDEEFPIYDDRLDIIDMFSKLYELAVSFYQNDTKNTIKSIFVYLIELGHILSIDDTSIIDSVLNKIKKNKERLAN